MTSKSEYSKVVTMDERMFLALVSKKASHFQPDICRKLTAYFSRAGLELRTHFIEDDAGVTAEIERAENSGCTSFLAVGGDGTVSLVASRIHGNPHRLGIIPAGTANTLARILGVPMNPDRAIKLAATSKNTRAIDAMEVNGQLCLLNISTGVSSSALSELDPKHKARAGMFSYVIGVARAIRKISPSDYEIIVDGRSHHLHAVEIHVTNTGVLGVPQYHIHEPSRIDDGKVEVLGLTDWNPQAIAETTLDVLLPRKKRAIRFIGEGSRISIRSAESVAVQGDGDIMSCTPVDITVKRRAVNIIVR